MKAQPAAPLTLALTSCPYAVGMNAFGPYVLKQILDKAAAAALQDAWAALAMPVLCYVGVYALIGANFRMVDFVRLR